MSSEKKEQKPLYEGYQPFKKGYQPTQGNLNVLNPPRGGSGVSSSGQSNNEKNSSDKD